MHKLIIQPTKDISYSKLFFDRFNFFRNLEHLKNNYNYKFCHLEMIKLLIQTNISLRLKL